MAVPVVDQKTCTGCGLCVSICPPVFEMREDQKAHVKTTAVCDECDCQNAIDSCPVDAISWKS